MTTSPVKIWRNQQSVTSLIGCRGTLLTWTLIRVPPEGFSDQAPYPVAIVELSDGRHITAQLVDWDQDDLHAGASVVTVVRKVFEPSHDGVIPYGIKVKPV